MSREYKILKNKKNVSLLNKILSISSDLKKGYNLKEVFLDIVNHATYETVDVWISKCVVSGIEEFIEETNNKIKVIKRNGFGYRSFKILRARILYIFNKKLKG